MINCPGGVAQSPGSIASSSNVFSCIEINMQGFVGHDLHLSGSPFVSPSVQEEESALRKINQTAAVRLFVASQDMLGPHSRLGIRNWR